MKSIKSISWLAIVLIALGVITAAPAFAQTAGQGNGGNGRGFGRGQMQGSIVSGSVVSVSGNTITVSGKQGFGSTAATSTYTVDATNAKVMKSGAASSIGNIATGDTIMVQGTINGTNVTATTIRDGFMQGLRNGGGVAGKVTSINPLTITVQVRPAAGTSLTYTINATNATVTKNGASSSVSAIAVGDMIAVQGTISGSTVTATSIRDGAGQGQMQIQGNGQPVVAGKISAISGNTVTISNSSSVSYTIDATNTKFSVKGVTSPTISNLAVGDNVIAQGTVNGNNVAASLIIDQKANTNGNGQGNNPGAAPKSNKGVMGGIVSFFKHLFGF